MAILLALAMVLIPLAIAPGTFFYYDVTPKTAILFLGTAVALVWWAARGAGGGFYRASRAARWFSLALLGMAASLILSTLCSTRPELSLGGSSWRYWGLIAQLATLGFVYLLASTCGGRPQSLRMILRGIVAGGLPVALYCIAQYFGWDPFLAARAYHAGEGVYTIVRPPATLGHADYAAGWLLFVVFCSLALAALEDSRAWKRLASSAATLGSIAIVLSGTRAALLGLLVGCALVLPAALRSLRGSRVSAAAIIAVAAGVLAAVTVFYLSPAGARMRARVHWSLDEPAGGARLLLWRDSLRMAAERPLTGYGPETFTGAFARHQSADLSRAFPDFYHESPHNILLDAFVAQGFSGPLFLLALLAAGCIAAWQLRANRAALALAGGLAGLTISGQFLSFTMPTALAYYTIVALLVSLAVPAELPAPRRRSIRVTLAAPGAIILTVMAVRLVTAETTLARVQRDLNAGHVGSAAAEYTVYDAWRWPYPSADLWYSRRLAQIAGSSADRLIRIQAFQEAGRAAERAPQTHEAAFNAYYNLAAFYAARNDFASTERSLRAAIADAPNWFKTHWMLAQVLEAANRFKEAEAEADIALSLDGAKHPEVTATRERIRTKLYSPQDK